MNKNVWQYDATNIDINTSEKDINDILYKNKSTDDFLTNDNKFIITSAKGYGKTFLLKIKSINFRTKSQGAIFIPKNELVDRIGSAIPPITKREDFRTFEDISNHEVLWRCAIMIAIVRNNSDLFDKIKNNPLIPEIIKQNFFYNSNPDYPFVQTIYTVLMSDYKLFISVKKRLPEIELIISSSNIPMYIFIDNIDEFYNKNQAHYEEQMWFSSQISLIETIAKLSSLFGHIHIYATIRKKALEKFKSEKAILYRQRLDSIVEIKYTKKDLKNIFIKNIQMDNDINLYNKSLKYIEPIEAFLGIKFFTNIYNANKEEEEAFEYIYRHTLGRPRDLMYLGNNISGIDKANNEKKELEKIIKRTINTVALDNGEQYLEEYNQFLNIDLKKIYKLIDKNILSYNEIQDICCNYNNKKTKNCKICHDAKHIFCELYSYGLVGIEKHDIQSDNCYQEFKSTGMQPLLNIEHTLPESKTYYIHPCLSELIMSFRNNNGIDKFYNKNIIVGYDKEINCSNDTFIEPEMIFINTSNADEY